MMLAREDIELELLLESMRLKYGHDFRNYARASLKRRVKNGMSRHGFRNALTLASAILDDESLFKDILNDFSITVTDIFRDPEFYKTFREQVVPVLSTWPSINLWCAGCATGEEAYSLAIVLREEKLLDKCRIYATDFNDTALAFAQKGIYALDRMAFWSKNYLEAGGRASFSDHYHARHDGAIMDEKLRGSIFFTNHNLVTDRVFGEMNAVVCRNVLIYFDKVLQNRVLSMFRDSLCSGGFLCLGPKETLRFSEVATSFVAVDEKHKIFRGQVASVLSPFGRGLG